MKLRTGVLVSLSFFFAVALVIGWGVSIMPQPASSIFAGFGAFIACWLGMMFGVIVSHAIGEEAPPREPIRL